MSLPERVLFLCDYQAPYGGSFIPSLLALEAALLAHGAHVYWLFPAGAKARRWCQELESGGHIVSYLSGGRLDKLRQLDKLVRSRQIRLIHAHFGLFPLALAEAMLHPRLRLVLHVHSDFSYGKSAPFSRRLVRSLPGMLAPRRIRRVMVGAHMADSERGAVWIPNGVDFSRTQSCAETRGSMREKLHIADDDKLALLFGWSPAVKGLDVAARAVMRLKKDKLRLAVVCGREMTAERLAAWLKARGCEYADILFLPPIENVYAYHRAADIMLSASRSETFSYALAEAIFTERPCVISDIPGTRWAAAYDTVTSFPSGDDAACAAALKIAAAGYPEDKLKRAAKSVCEDCAMERWVTGVLALYGDLFR